MSRRSYHQNCSLARALDLVGERWTLLLVRELLISSRRFKDLLEGLSGIGTNLLAERLKALEKLGLVEREVLPPPSFAQVYNLTEQGRALEPTLLELVRWGLTISTPGHKNGLSRPDWDLLAMKAIFQPNRARHLKVLCQVETEEIKFYFLIKGKKLGTWLGSAPNPDLFFEADNTILKEVFLGEKVLSKEMAEGRIRLKGSKKLAETVLKCFHFLPVPK